MKPNKNRLSTEPYKGVRDFPPRDMAIFNHITDTMRSVAEQFGFESYQTSLLEPTELYMGKTSEEIVNEQTYTFADRGGRSVTLRPEMTPSVARLVAHHRRDLRFPVRWYTIANCFRYERPQRGRVREHWQLNCDIFGDTGSAGEIEIILLAHALMRAFGATDDMFVIKINDRSILADTLVASARDAGVPLSNDVLHAVLRVMDRKEKLTKEEYAQAMRDAVGAQTADAILSAYTPESARERIASLPSFSGFMEVHNTLQALGVSNVVHEPNLVRGFDYYTGLVFEVFDTSRENPRSLFGGGRYDKLMELFAQPPLPAVGFGMGDVTIRDFLETHGLLPEFSSHTSLYIGTIGGTTNAAQALAQELRKKDITVAINLEPNRKVSEQIRHALEQHITHFLVIGEDEVRTNIFSLKHLPTSAEQKISREEIPDALFTQGL